MLNTITKRLVTGLLVGGLISAAPALAQSALAQQSTAQQGSKSSTTSASTAKSGAPQSTASKSTTAKPATSKATTAAKKAPPKPLVYVEDNRSTKNADASATKNGDASISKNSSTGKTATVSAKKPSDTSADQKPLSADVTKAFAQNCPSVALTASKSKAAYNVTFERDPASKGVKSAFGLRKSSRIEVMSRGGKELFSESGHSTGQLVKDACTAIGTPDVKVAQK